MVANKDNLRTFNLHSDEDGEYMCGVDDESGQYCLTADYLEMDGMWQESYRKKCDDVEALKRGAAIQPSNPTESSGERSATPRIPDWKNARSIDQPDFMFWMSALTSEGLHAKADIARLLAMLTQDLTAARQRIELEANKAEMLKAELGMAWKAADEARQRIEGLEAAQWQTCMDSKEASEGCFRAVQAERFLVAAESRLAEVEAESGERKEVMDMLLLCGEEEGFDFNGAEKLRAIINGLITQRQRADLAEHRLSAAEDKRDALSDIYWVVQYRHKHEGIQWQNMAAFDFELAAKNYAEKCSEVDVPWEYRYIHKDAIDSAIRHLKEKS